MTRSLVAHTTHVQGVCSHFPYYCCTSSQTRLVHQQASAGLIDLFIVVILLRRVQFSPRKKQIFKWQVFNLTLLSKCFSHSVISIE